MRFSIVVATRNRPGPLTEALESLESQRHEDLEIVVVVDGSAAPPQTAYKELEGRFSKRARFLYLNAGQRGLGPSAARNQGAACATGDYLGFLDDDDVWTDPDHLARAAECIAANDTPVDVYYADQDAFRAGERLPGPLWLGALAGRLRSECRAADGTGAYRVSASDLLGAGGFAHLNATLIRRGFFEQLGGLDEDIRYEEDRDLFLRSVDRASGMVYAPHVVGRHNIPSSAPGSSASTRLPDLAKRLYQLRLLDKAIMLSARPEVRAHGRTYKGYTLKAIATELHRAGQPRRALFYAREALGVAFSLKWTAVAALMGLRALIQKSDCGG